MPVIIEVFAVRYKTPLCAALDPNTVPSCPTVVCLRILRCCWCSDQQHSDFGKVAPELGVGSPLYAVVLMSPTSHDAVRSCRGLWIRVYVL